ncbi:transcriptional regulator (plasmid) [Azospirillum sp. B510]|uniref:helix-turn-helix domain-containing protein n=1 Tax=Azospirillum sp. (strain B510) TaxID=137722 RepID=UPI0001C4BC75|nr:helix-turn-helix domain-containing protein [Azospirillum sp. B510]BAI74501.1 transcriptional regulator [Azospirillum sp. B510]
MDGHHLTEQSALGQTLNSLKFDSAALAPEQAFFRWREELSVVFDTTVDNYDFERRFRGSLETFHLGGLLLTKTVSGRQRFTRTHRTIARSGIDHFLIQAHAKGGFRGAADEREFEIGAGDICIFDLSRPCATLSTEFSNVTFCLPRSALEPLVEDPEALHGLVLPAQSAAGILLTDHLLSLFRAAGRLRADEAMAVGGRSMAFVAGCLQDAASRSGERRKVRAALSIQVRRFIEQQLHDPELGPEIIVAALGVSRATLFRMYEAAGGVASYIRKRRLVRSLADLRAPLEAERIADIALKWGFRSEGSYSRAFRAVYGLSPSEFRAGVNGPAFASFQDVEDLRLGHWVRNLALP